MYWSGIQMVNHLPHLNNVQFEIPTSKSLVLFQVFKWSNPHCMVKLSYRKDALDPSSKSRVPNFIFTIMLKYYPQGQIQSTKFDRRADFIEIEIVEIVYFYSHHMKLTGLDFRT